MKSIEAKPQQIRSASQKSVAISGADDTSHKKKRDKLEKSSKPRKEQKTTVYYEKYYKGRPVKIIDQSEYRYTIRDTAGKDFSVPKSEVKILKKKGDCQ